jgi:hypothetical protein
MVFALPALESSAFVGFRFPGEIAVFLAGVLAFEGRIGLASAILAAVGSARLIPRLPSSGSRPGYSHETMIGAPAPPGSLFPYEAATALGALGSTIGSQLGGLPAGILTWHPDGREWCINEVMGHLIEAERRGFAGRIMEILDQDEPTFVPWDQAAVARARDDCRRDPSDLLLEFATVRAESAGLVARLTDTDLARGGMHPAVGRLRVVDVVHEWLHHDANHLRQILANVQAAVWPHMGNAQRFSQPG